MRVSRPWFWAQKNAWYVQPKSGKQIRLGRHPADAPPPTKDKGGNWNVPDEIQLAYHKAMAADPAHIPPASTLTVLQVCDLFLDYSDRHHAPDTYQNYRHFLQSFCNFHGRLLAVDVRPIHVTRWLDAHPSWTGGRRHAVLAIKRAYSWADKQGLINPNPLKAVAADPVGRRTRVLSREEQAEILAAIRDQPFKDFVFALTETGCRPSEVARVTTDT